MKRSVLFLACILVVGICVLAQAKESTAEAKAYSLHFSSSLNSNGAIQVNLNQINGFHGIIVEHVTSESESAQVLRMVSAGPNYGDDPEKNSMEIVLPIKTSLDAPVTIRLKDMESGATVCYIVFNPKKGPKDATLSLEQTVTGNGMTALGCPIGCFKAKMADKDCGAEKCCRNGNVTYNFDLCTITCRDGNC